MANGIVLAIYIAPEREMYMQSVNSVRAVPGRGLEGDRYFKRIGTFSKKDRPDRELSLIEVEAIDALKHDYGINLDPGESRRNIVTKGVPLNHLVGREFCVGEATLRGIKLCEPCSHLEKLTKIGVKHGLIHRGGLRAQIITEGVITVGDKIEGLLVSE